MIEFPKDQLSQEDIEKGRKLAEEFGVTEEQFQNYIMTSYDVLKRMLDGELTTNMQLVEEIDKATGDANVKLKMFLAVKVYHSYQESMANPINQLRALLKQAPKAKA